MGHAQRLAPRRSRASDVVGWFAARLRRGAKRVGVIVMTVVLGMAGAVSAESPWHRAGWSHRAVVEVVERSPGGQDVAAVRVRHNGVIEPDARDLRVADADGRALPYQVDAILPQREVLLRFRAEDGAARYHVYFGNADAPRDPMRATVDPSPGGGPPTAGVEANGWVPRVGLVLITKRRPRDADNPESVDEIAKLLRESPAIDGAGYRRVISDGVNPFGNSDYFLSVYRGWLHLPRGGEYGFCTASNEASFSFMDGEPLVHWPGRHTEKRGRFGQKSVERSVEAGPHYVEYFHEEVLLYQTAFLGYRPPGTVHFVGMPRELWPQPHRANVVRYEQASQGMTVLAGAELVDSVWPRGRGEGQWTRYRLHADAGAKAVTDGWRFAWHIARSDSPDRALALRTDEPTVDVVLMNTGSYAAQLTATAPDGTSVLRKIPLNVFPVEHLAGVYRKGQLKRYLPIVSDYPAEQLATRDAVEFARLMLEAKRFDRARAGAGHALTRDDLTDHDAVDMHLLLAVHGPTDQRDEHLRHAAARADGPAQRIDIFAKQVRALGIDGRDVEQATAIFDRARNAAKAAGIDGQVRAALREATIAMGDVLLQARQWDEARVEYRAAELLAATVIPAQVKAAQIGRYHEAVAARIETGDVATAKQAADEWRAKFPTDLLRGELPFWLGVIALKQDHPTEATRWLALAVELGEGSEFEAEARYRLAEAYLAAGQDDRARHALRGLAESHLDSSFRERAIEELETEGAR